MIVADSSYIAEGLLVDSGLLDRDQMVAPDLAVYETIGVVWKHQVVLGRISEGTGYLLALSDLVRSNRLVALEPDDELAKRTFELAVRYHVHPHDAVFVALAVMTGLELRTLDASQKKIHEKERARRGSTGRNDLSRQKVTELD